MYIYSYDYDYAYGKRCMYYDYNLNQTQHCYGANISVTMVVKHFFHNHGLKYL